MQQSLEHLLARRANESGTDLAGLAEAFGDRALVNALAAVPAIKSKVELGAVLVYLDLGFGPYWRERAQEIYAIHRVEPRPPLSPEYKLACVQLKSMAILVGAANNIVLPVPAMGECEIFPFCRIPGVVELRVSSRQRFRLCRPHLAEVQSVGRAREALEAVAGRAAPGAIHVSILPEV